MRLILSIIILLFAVPSFSQDDHLVTVNTRPGVTVSFYYMKRPEAKTSIILLMGSGGNIGIRNGIPTSRNFLVRSRDLFAAKGFNVAIVDRPSDTDDLDGTFRTSREHIEDLKQVIAFLKKDTEGPVWLIGTSMGTISAASAAISIGNDGLSGVVLTSSITSRKKSGAVPWQPLENVRIPILLVHHELDACQICVPGDVVDIAEKLKNAPVKKLIYVNGGKGAQGNPCKALHWHGFIGMEKEAVDIISDWIKKPVS